MNIELCELEARQRQNSNLRQILAQLDGFLSKYSNGMANGTTTSPALSLTVNITIVAPSSHASGGGAESGNVTVNYTDKRR